MKNKLSCEQVKALFDFFYNDKLNTKLKTQIYEHLSECNSCRNLYEQLGIRIELNDSDRNISINEEYMLNISAYIDNELPANESIRLKKVIITNPIIRKDLERMLSIKKILHNTVEKTKNDFKTDLSKNIINNINGVNRTNPFNKLIWTFAGMISAIMIGFLFLAALYF